MSFSKAKIQRFNDVKACTPSPAKYNVASKEKVKLGFISQLGKYGKKSQTPPNSDTGSVKSDAKSVHSTPIFQTPTAAPLKRKKLLRMSFIKSSKTEGKLMDQEELREKIVECNNKDLYIADLIEQIEEMKEKYNLIKTNCMRLESEKSECEKVLAELRKENFNNYNVLSNNLKEVNDERLQIRQLSQDLKNQNFVELSKVWSYLRKFEVMYNETLMTAKEGMNNKISEMKQKENELIAEIVLLKQSNEEQKRNSKQKGDLILKLREAMESLKSNFAKEKEDYERMLQEDEAKIIILEENFKEVNLLSELQIQQRIDEIEQDWRQKLEEKDKESEAILKECQAISEYNIIQCEIEKNSIKKELETKDEEYQTLLQQQNANFETQMKQLKTEKHAYELSITTFKDTIEVLKTRLINSDSDVEQLKSELEKNEALLLKSQQKCSDLVNQLCENQQAYEELEMQYESTSKLMQNQVETIQRDLLFKVDILKEESLKLQKDKELFQEVLHQHHEQQELINEAQEVVAQSYLSIEILEKKQLQLESELKCCQEKLHQETEDAAEIRKKYIETSGKYDKLAQQFEQILQELDVAKSRIQELENSIGSYQEQVEAYESELKILKNEKAILAAEAKELGSKCAEFVGHQNSNQKIKQLSDLKVNSSELFQKNIDLESHNYKLSKLVEKLSNELDNIKISGKKVKIGCDDKENIGSPKCLKNDINSPRCLKNTQSPGPLKSKN